MLLPLRGRAVGIEAVIEVATKGNRSSSCSSNSSSNSEDNENKSSSRRKGRRKGRSGFGAYVRLVSRMGPPVDVKVSLLIKVFGAPTDVAEVALSIPFVRSLRWMVVRRISFSPLFPARFPGFGLLCRSSSFAPLLCLFFVSQISS